VFIVATYIDKSSIEGVGAFAAEPIAKGQRISRFEPDFDRLIPMADYLSAPPHLKALLDRYAFPHPKRPDYIFYEVDNCRFINHAADPNTDFSDPDAGFALRDIAAGEEITCDYAQFYSDYELLAPEIELQAKGA